MICADLRYALPRTYFWSVDKTAVSNGKVSRNLIRSIAAFDDAELVLACMGKDEATPASAGTFLDAVCLSILQHHDAGDKLNKSLDARLLVRSR